MLHTYIYTIHIQYNAYTYYKKTLSISRQKTLAECIQFSSHNILYNKIYSNKTYTTCIHAYTDHMIHFEQKCNKLNIVITVGPQLSKHLCMYQFIFKSVWISEVNKP